MDRIILANWKAEIDSAGADRWFQDFSSRYRQQEDVQIIVAVPFLFMERVAEKFAALERVAVAAQGVSPFPPGSYTGATPAAWLTDFYDYVLIGHRERRRYFHEDSRAIGSQIRETVDAGLRPILCVNEATRHNDLAAVDSTDLDRLWLAYTPESASFGTDQETAAMHQGITETAASLHAASGGRPVLYGGGVTAGNCAGLLQIDGISGVMAGRSCLDGTGFAELVAAV